jgi:protein-tyrosine phosphatase
MSRCKRPPQLGPAFDLKIVHEHNPVDHGCPVGNAAACEEMSDILGCLSLGSWRDAADPEKLKARGITHVLNVAKEVPPSSEREAMESGDFCHKTIPLVDCHSQNIDEHFEDAFTFIQDARAQNGKVLVHCRRGISRSAAIVVGYLMSHENYTYEEALDFVKEKRSCVSLNLAFRQILSEYVPGTCGIIASPAIVNKEDPSNGGASVSDEPHSRMDSYMGEDFGLSAPESEKSSQPSTNQPEW